MLLGAGLALSLAAGNGPPAPAPAPAPAPQPDPAADQAPPQDLAIYPPASSAAPARPAPYVGVIGDSTATQLVKPLADQLGARGVGVVGATVGGCQPTDVVLTYQSHEYFERHQNCPKDAQRRQHTLVARFHPKAVVWADAMEWSDIQAGDRLVTAGSDQWRQLMLAGWDRTLSRLGDASVVLILPTWWAGYPTATPPSFPVEGQRALFRTWAARHQNQVSLVDLGPVLCPAGPPCRQVVDGVQLRSDHVHYTTEGSRRVIAKIMADSAVLRGLGARPTASVSVPSQ